MKGIQLTVVLLASFFTSSYQLSKPEDATYWAAVVEHKEAEGDSPRQRTNSASVSFQKIIKEVDEVDIIVFPEHLLNSRSTATFVPHESQNITPCYQADYELFLIEISCAARSRSLYVVINVVEKELCANGAGSDTFGPCPSTGVRYFNTNVVFDRRGRVISRYRKGHLWRHEYAETSVLRSPDISTFDTDFGVTFGHFICFDMLFYEPAVQLVRELNITDIVYPTYWFSELPFLGAVQLQEGWAFGNDVNLLAADASQPGGKTTGSGIYAGRGGRLVAEIFEEPTTKLMISEVPKRSRGQLAPTFTPVFTPQLKTQRVTGVATFRDYNVDIFESELLPEDFLSLERQLCHGSFCCSFAVERKETTASAGEVTSTDPRTYRYRIAAYWGNQTTVIRVDRTEQAVCALFACTDAHISTCGYIFPADQEVINKHHFTKLNIAGDFPAAPRGRRLIMPSTLNALFLPVAVSDFDWTESPEAGTNPDKPTSVALSLAKSQNDLLTFAIWANYFTDLPSTHNLDHMQPNDTSPSASGAFGMFASSGLWVLTCLFLITTRNI
ncbi:vanin-like protein 1 [Drosophila biarmipes]|uniref:vanin-like protein 1 n=1 Tax=Drosophila biarmipes TaxID=125945 RepID=UPI0007E8B415|nr:vanin-like protein 1 [Drosophila biarmipes]